MNKFIKTPLRYPGGKSRAVKKILPLIPEFDEFREPFLGGGSIFIASKQIHPHQTFWINDIYEDLYCFWIQLQNNTEKLLSEIQNIYDKYKELDDGKLLFELMTKKIFYEELEKAVKFFVLNRITFSGTIEAGGYSKGAFDSRFTQSSIDRLIPFKNLLNGVKISSHDYSKLISKEGNNVFIFLDPPYYSATKSKLYGKKGSLHINFDHERFAETIKSTQHKWLITYDNSEEIRKLYKDYNLIEWELQYGMNNYKKTNAPKGKELIITNY